MAASHSWLQIDPSRCYCDIRKPWPSAWPIAGGRGRRAEIPAVSRSFPRDGGPNKQPGGGQPDNGALFASSSSTTNNSPVGVLELLLYRHPQAFDVNYWRPDRTPKHIYDPRERVQQDYTRGFRPHTDELEITALRMAVNSGHWDAVAFFLDRGAEKYARDGLGRTAMEIATVEGHTRVEEVLKLRGGLAGLFLVILDDQLV
ncbi:hypothetical protein PG984_014030 [Apiospora sp. TS-2023a]